MKKSEKHRKKEKLFEKMNKMKNIRKKGPSLLSAIAGVTVRVVLGGHEGSMVVGLLEQDRVVWGPQMADRSCIGWRRAPNAFHCCTDSLHWACMRPLTGSVKGTSIEGLDCPTVVSGDDVRHGLRKRLEACVCSIRCRSRCWCSRLNGTGLELLFR